MNPLRPIHNVVDAIVMPFKALFVVGLCAAINAATYHGHWWFKWVALGMGIATVVALARGARSLLTVTRRRRRLVDLGDAMAPTRAGASTSGLPKASRRRDACWRWSAPARADAATGGGSGDNDRPFAAPLP